MNEFSTGTDVELRKSTELRRYELVVGGVVASFVEYVEQDGVVELPHTVTNPSHRGQGYAARVVAYALDDIRANGQRVNPTCWFAADLICNDQASYADLLA